MFKDKKNKDHPEISTKQFQLGYRNRLKGEFVIQTDQYFNIRKCAEAET